MGSQKLKFNLLYKKIKQKRKNLTEIAQEEERTHPNSLQRFILHKLTADPEVKKVSTCCQKVSLGCKSISVSMANGDQLKIDRDLFEETTSLETQDKKLTSILRKSLPLIKPDSTIKETFTLEENGNETLLPKEDFQQLMIGSLPKSACMILGYIAIFPHKPNVQVSYQ